MKSPLFKEKILPYLKENLTADRLGHVMGVAYLAEKIARRHGLDPFKARMAGLLHDAAKCWKKKDLKKYARKHRLKVPDLEQTCERQPGLLHAYVGADLVKKIFGIKDPEILSAIAKHSLADVRMTPFDKCVYLADLAAPGRKFPEAKVIRKMALKNLDKAFLEGLRVKLHYTVQDGCWIHPQSIRVWNSFMDEA